jgi:hypothetical protein
MPWWGPLALIMLIGTVPILYIVWATTLSGHDRRGGRPPKGTKVPWVYDHRWTTQELKDELIRLSSGGAPLIRYGAREVERARKGVIRELLRRGFDPDDDMFA